MSKIVIDTMGNITIRSSEKVELISDMSIILEVGNAVLTSGYSERDEYVTMYSSDSITVRVEEYSRGSKKVSKKDTARIESLERDNEELATALSEAQQKNGDILHKYSELEKQLQELNGRLEEANKMIESLIAPPTVPTVPTTPETPETNEDEKGSTKEDSNNKKK